MAKLYKTVFGPRGPVKVHRVAYDRRNKKPIEDYGSEEGGWDATSFKKEKVQLRQDEVETQVTIIKRQVRKDLFLEFFNKTAQ